MIEIEKLLRSAAVSTSFKYPPYHYDMHTFSSKALQTALNSFYVAVFGIGSPTIPVSGTFMKEVSYTVRNLTPQQVLLEAEVLYDFSGKPKGTIYLSLFNLCNTLTSITIDGSEFFIKNHRFIPSHNSLTNILRSIITDRTDEKSKPNREMVEEFLTLARSPAVIIPLAIDLAKKGLQIKESKTRVNGKDIILTENERQIKLQEYMNYNSSLIIEHPRAVMRQYSKDLSNYLNTAHVVMNHLIEMTFDEVKLVDSPPTGRKFTPGTFKGGKRTRKLYKRNRTRFHRLKNKSKK
jgi:hypothetical protein